MSDTLVLSRSDVRQALDLGACIDAVERAFLLHGTGEAPSPAVASVHVPGGGFHVKAGVLPFGTRSWFVSKTNANFPGNPEQHGLPTIQGTIVVCDARLGTPLALMDSMELTAVRTAAASAVAAKHLARPGASTLALIGCGLQGEYHARALPLVRHLGQVILYDREAGASHRLAEAIHREGVGVTVASTPAAAAREADIVVTCTTSTEFLLEHDAVRPGAFVAAVGVDAEHKKELAPHLLSRSKVVVDVLAQAAGFGDLHHAIDAGAMTAADVHAELGAVVAGRRPGRESDREVIVFDSTGMALQDVAAAALAYERASTLGLGRVIDLSA